jgi:hypothetical protein
MAKGVLLATSIVLTVFALSYGLLAGSVSPTRLLAAVESQQAQPPAMPDMMKMHEQMMAEMKDAGVKLDRLVDEMNSATGEARISAIARVVNEIARQQKMMYERMGTMHQQMMSGQGMMMKR